LASTRIFLMCEMLGKIPSAIARFGVVEHVMKYGKFPPVGIAIVYAGDCDIRVPLEKLHCFCKVSKEVQANAILGERCLKVVSR
jgi:hypothetical protein